MSNTQPAIFARFINRRKGLTASPVAPLSRISINKDLRQFCDTFDFEITLKLDDVADIRSHDFIEFYTIIDGAKFQIGAGYIEDFVKDTASNAHRIQANGRDFMGQLFTLPFFKAKAIQTTTIMKFAELIVSQNYIIREDQNDHTTYMHEYLNLKNVSRKVVDAGAYKLLVNIPELSDSKVAPILQSTAEELFNVVYQNRFGQMTIWGNDNLNEFITGETLSESGDENVLSLTVRENFSKVFSEVKVLYTGGQGASNYDLLKSQIAVNTESKARQIFNPELRNFQNSTLVTKAPSNEPFEDKVLAYAQSIMRKSNQNLEQVVIKTSRPYFVKKDGTKKAYEQHQQYIINAPSHKIHKRMRLVGISYQQDSGSLHVELLFILPESVI